MAVVAVLAIAGGTAAFLFLSSDPDPSPEDRAAPAEGLACTHLLRAADAHERGDSAAFDREIAQAAAIAEETLQKSGEVFGEPERIALELELGSEQRAQRLLQEVDNVCSPPGD